MVRALAAKLAEWQDDPAVTRVVVTANGGRAFSAGGDLRGLYDLGRAGRYDEALSFFREEYVLNALIKHYRKPYVSLIDGIVMGGGAGISVHGSHRVAGDRFAFAMPEVGIGFFPDIGATWFLTRMPGELGVYCALTGERLNAADGVGAGIATHRVATSRFPGTDRGAVRRRSRSMRSSARLRSLPARRRSMARQRGDRPAVQRRPRRGYSRGARPGGGGGADPKPDFARSTAALMRTKSPLSLKITLRQLRLGKSCDFDRLHSHGIPHRLARRARTRPL